MNEAPSCRPIGWMINSVLEMIVSCFRCTPHGRVVRGGPLAVRPARNPSARRAGQSPDDGEARRSMSARTRSPGAAVVIRPHRVPGTRPASVVDWFRLLTLLPASGLAFGRARLHPLGGRYRAPRNSSTVSPAARMRARSVPLAMLRWSGTTRRR